MIKDWNHERHRTRDRLYYSSLADYYNCPTPMPSPIIYPIENFSSTVLSKQLYQIALNNGYTGSLQDFFDKFSSNNGEIIRGTIATFPVPGSDTNFYFDEETKILYHFKTVNQPVNEDIIRTLGAIIVSTNDAMTHLYIPIRAMPLEDIILNCGSAADFY